MRSGRGLIVRGSCVRRNSRHRYGGCTGGLVDGCCTIDTSDENHSYSWWALTTSGDHGTMQVFSDEHCSEDASPVVDWKEGACVDTNGSGKLIKSIRTTQ